MPTVCCDGFAAPPLKRLLQAVLAGGSCLIQTVGGHPRAHRLPWPGCFWHAFLPDEPFWNGFVESGKLSGCTNRLSGILCEEWGRFGNRDAIYQIALQNMAIPHLRRGRRGSATACRPRTEISDLDDAIYQIALQNMAIAHLRCGRGAPLALTRQEQRSVILMTRFAKSRYKT